MKKYVGIMLAAAIFAGCIWTVHQEKANTESNGGPGTPAEAGGQAGNKPEQRPGDSGLTLEAAYFNDIVEVNGKKEIANPDNMLALVNKVFQLPGDYEPDDLTRPDVTFAFGDQDIEKSYLRKEAADALEKMFQAAKKDGITLYASSGYRSYDRQEAIFQNEINKVGESKASEVVAVPGNSEHQTGLAMDITSQSVQLALSEEFGETKEGKWLQKNAHKYGFILRYPKGREKITGYDYEPWHFRYVGKKAAKVIYEHGWTLEEYFEHVTKI
jgi:D-alanyl-D-alanine carboxypeptidase